MGCDWGCWLGGMSRYALTRVMLQQTSVPVEHGADQCGGMFCDWVLWDGLTLSGGRYTVSENARMFVMIGICGGFTTFSSFSLQTFDLLRSGAWGRALMNVRIVGGALLFFSRAGALRCAADEWQSGDCADGGRGVGELRRWLAHCICGVYGIDSTFSRTGS